MLVAAILCGVGLAAWRYIHTGAKIKAAERRPVAAMAAQRQRGTRGLRHSI